MITKWIKSKTIPSLWLLWDSAQGREWVVISLPFPPLPTPVGNWESSWSECCLSMPRLWPGVPLLVSLRGSRAGASRCCNAAGQRGCWAPRQRDLRKARNVLNHNVLNAHRFVWIFLQIEKWWKQQMCVWVQGRDSHIFLCEGRRNDSACCSLLLIFVSECLKFHKRY